MNCSDPFGKDCGAGFVRQKKTSDQMRRFYVAVPSDRLENRQRLKGASYLHDFLIDHQTDPAGRVWYGRPISYTWIQSRWSQAPSTRTLHRYMRALKNAGLVQVKKAALNDGMIVTLIRSVKWQTPATVEPITSPRTTDVTRDSAIERPRVLRCVG